MDKNPALPEHEGTIARLHGLKREAKDGTPFWMARDIHPVLGYPTWREFESVIDRARAAFSGNGIDPSHQIVLTPKLMGGGRGAQQIGDDYFLSQSACYLIAMNGEPSKPEIAAAQAYFVVRTRESEMRENDEKRMELRVKFAQAHKAVSDVAQKAGVRNQMQGKFHDARFLGLYGMSAWEVRRKKGLADSENLFDRAGRMELSTNEFEMNLAANVIAREQIKGEDRVIAKNREIAKYVRGTIKDSGGTFPEDLPLEEPIQEVKKRLSQHQKRNKKKLN